MKGALGFEVVKTPETGLWRVARLPDPLQLPPPTPDEELFNESAGNRYDSPLSNYRVIYAGTTLACCFAETLARFRVDQQLPLQAIKDEWAHDHRMTLGSIPADWRVQRLKANFLVPKTAMFVDVDHPQTVKAIRFHHGEFLSRVGIHDLDLGDIIGKNRLITRWISHLVHEHSEFSGIRYRSRLDGELEAWAVFDRCQIDLVSQETIDKHDKAMRSAATKLGLTVH